MIESIQIAGEASYANTPEILHRLSKINFFYGANGSGKTTISRVVANAGSFASCSVNWKGGTALKAMVYNRDFVHENFSTATGPKGIFTLGKNDIDTLTKIATAKAEHDASLTKIEKLKINLAGENGSGGKNGELAEVEDQFKEKCWLAYTKHKQKLVNAFDGFRNSKDSFRDKVIRELNSNSASLLSLQDIEEKASTVFGSTPTNEPTLATIQATQLIGYESDPVLTKRVIGKGDVDIAAMIKKLGNSDWVREGRSFYDVNESTCPFCQQSVAASFTHSLNEYFDETFTTDTANIEKLISNYSTEAERLQLAVSQVIASQSRFLDAENLKREKELLDSKIIINIQKLASKKKEPSQIIELESVGNVVSTILTAIAETNAAISTHNNTVANLAQEKRTLTAQVWKYLIDVDLKTDLAAYSTKTAVLNAAIKGMNSSIDSATTEMKAKAFEIRNLEKDSTSTQPTVDGINLLLSSFGFRGFSLAKAGTGNFYKLIRADGTDAKETLSEGERTFVTFLYFYHLLKGSNSESEITTNRVVVFDDPVSSLDSDILFLVGSLIKDLFDEVRTGVGHIKQIFVLTHNVYFHKEVTFNPKRSGSTAMKSEETFWVVRKLNLLSKLEHHESNPIKTSYELLWSEVRRPDRSNLTIQNTLRRILENYFKILGGVDLNDLNAKFDGQEKLICKSLISWVNDGSHFSHDDLYVSISDSMIEPYLNVFREIFKKSDHMAHYKMMMGDAYVEVPASTPEPAAV
nr:AAA family ATPase [uncultured Albidiferax sp.]